MLLTILTSVAAFVLANFLARFFAKTDLSERGIYAYSFMFSNMGYLGDPVTLALFGETGFTYYKIFTLPLSILVFTWGISVLIPSTAPESTDTNKAARIMSGLKKALNPPTIAMLLGMLVGVTDTVGYIPGFVTNALDTLKVCMGPSAMLAAGFTIAAYGIKDMMSQKKVYIATGLRLVIIPAIIIPLLYVLKLGVGALLGVTLNNNILFYAIFAFAGPLGLNTVVFPKAYGGDARTGAAMTLVSHTLCMITIPLVYTLIELIFGGYVF